MDLVEIAIVRLDHKVTSFRNTEDDGGCHDQEYLYGVIGLRQMLRALPAEISSEGI
jgi:hypothetical protein